MPVAPEAQRSRVPRFGVGKPGLKIVDQLRQGDASDEFAVKVLFMR
jgi:hypothetical protein